MKPLKKLISIEEARRIVLENTIPVEETEVLPLAQAAGRVLASPVVSTVPVPPFSRAAMDGYAVKAGQTVGAGRYNPVRLDIAGRVYAGRMPEEEAGPSKCLQIATGAPLPGGADAVVKVEDTDLDGEAVLIKKPAYPGENVAPAGEDIKPGDRLLERGAILTPSRVGAAAALGLAALEVFRKPRIRIYTTGDEIHPPGDPLPPGKVYDINSFTLGALLGPIGVDCETGGNVEDDAASIRRALAGGGDRDLVLFSGGSSAGDKDMLADVLAEQGEVRFHGIALKPGKPTLFGSVAGVPVFGLPGFPASCLAVGLLLVAPCARRMARRPEDPPKVVRATVAEKIFSSVGRHQIFTVRLEEGRVHPAYKESGDITSLSASDGYVEIPPTVEILDAGDEVEVVLF
jgi:molybdenum cofactor synthesis domain-containing protein